MRASTWCVIAACGAFVAAACGQVTIVYETGEAGPDATFQDSPLLFGESGAEASAPPPSTHDAGPPEASTLSFPCVDAGPDATSTQQCPPPASYCTDDYAVVYKVAVCSDAGTCVFPQVVSDCLQPNYCDGCFADDAGHAWCSCGGIVGE